MKYGCYSNLIANIVYLVFSTLESKNVSIRKIIKENIPALAKTGKSVLFQREQVVQSTLSNIHHSSAVGIP